MARTRDRGQPLGRSKKNKRGKGKSRRKRSEKTTCACCENGCAGDGKAVLATDANPSQDKPGSVASIVFQRPEPYFGRRSRFRHPVPELEAVTPSWDTEYKTEFTYYVAAAAPFEPPEDGLEAFGPLGGPPPDPSLVPTPAVEAAPAQAGGCCNGDCGGGPSSAQTGGTSSESASVPASAAAADATDAVNASASGVSETPTPEVSTGSSFFDEAPVGESTPPPPEEVPPVRRRPRNTKASKEARVSKLPPGRRQRKRGGPKTNSPVRRQGASAGGGVGKRVGLAADTRKEYSARSTRSRKKDKEANIKTTTIVKKKKKRRSVKRSAIRGGGGRGGGGGSVGGGAKGKRKHIVRTTVDRAQREIARAVEVVHTNEVMAADAALAGSADDTMPAVATVSSTPAVAQSSLHAQRIARASKAITVEPQRRPWTPSHHAAGTVTTLASVTPVGDASAPLVPFVPRKSLELNPKLYKYQPPSAVFGIRPAGLASTEVERLPPMGQTV